MAGPYNGVYGQRETTQEDNVRVRVFFFLRFFFLVTCFHVVRYMTHSTLLFAATQIFSAGWDSCLTPPCVWLRSSLTVVQWKIVGFDYSYKNP